MCRLSASLFLQHPQSPPAAAAAEWFFDQEDRSCQRPAGSYASALQLPLGCDMEMRFDPGSDYRPRWVQRMHVLCKLHHHYLMIMC